MTGKCIRVFVLILLAFLMIPYTLQTADAAENEILRGGISILKTDVLGKGLSGVGYQIAREASYAELRDSSVIKRLLTADGQTMTVVYSSFWDSRDMAGEKKEEVITDADGCAVMYGLPYGTYYLVESKPPEGYNKMDSPVRVTVNKYSHLTSADDVRDDADTVIDNTVHIITVRYVLPDTGNAVSSCISIPLMGLTVSLGILLFLIRFWNRYMI